MLSTIDKHIEKLYSYNVVKYKEPPQTSKSYCSNFYSRRHLTLKQCLSTFWGNSQAYSVNFSDCFQQI